MLLNLIMKAETEGLDELDEIIELAVALITTGLVNSTGSNQRYVEAVASEWPQELAAALERTRS